MSFGHHIPVVLLFRKNASDLNFSSDQIPKHLVNSNIFVIFMSVKKKVKDMNETLSSLVAEIQSLRDTVDSQFVEICQLNRNTERLLKENRELRIRLEKYERPSKDSNNSSTPPAKESIPAQVARCTKSQR